MTKKALIYARVSTSDGKQDYNRQIDELNVICKSHGYKEKDILVFAEALSGYKKEERLQLKALNELVESDPSQIGCIYTSEISRIGRNPTDTRTQIDRWTDLGIPLYIQSLQQFTLDKLGKRNMTMNIILQVLIEYANLEAETFKTRSKSGLLRSAKSGKGMGGIKPYGYKNDRNGLLVIDTAEAEWVRFIYESYANGQGTLAIAGVLNARGVKTKYKGTKESDRVIKGSLKSVSHIQWSDAQVYGIITNPIYKGERHFKDEVISVTPIVKPDLWNKCNAIRETKSHRNYLTTHTYLLKDLCTCGKCGRNYFGRYKKDEKVYICTSRIKSGNSCGSYGVNINLIESAIFHYLVKNSDKLSNIQSIEKMKKDLWNKTKTLTDKANVDQKLLKAKHNEKVRLLDLYISGGIDKGLYTERYDKIMAEVETISSRLAVIERDVRETDEALSRAGKSSASGRMLTEAKSNRNELQGLFRQILDRVVVDTLDRNKANVDLYLKVSKKPVHMVLDMSGIKRKEPVYSYSVGKDTFKVDQKQLLEMK
jgi:DNA invertase Pin-like site-specific DNA recombinase